MPAENAVLRQVGDIFVASGHDRGRWMFAAGPSFPGAGLPAAHDGALFFRTDLAAHYIYGSGTWTLVGGSSSTDSDSRFLSLAAQ